MTVTTHDRTHMPKMIANPWYSLPRPNPDVCLTIVSQLNAARAQVNRPPLTACPYCERDVEELELEYEERNGVKHIVVIREER